MFVNHEHGQFQIPAAYGNISLILIAAIICVVSLVSFKRIFEKAGEQGKTPIREETTILFRGVAIILLLLGHFSIKCISGKQVFEYSGEWAVTIFLLISGTGLAKRYGLEDIGNDFLLKRIKKLAVPIWLTLFLFYVLDYALLGRVHGWQKIILSFVGIINAGPPNGPDWFIPYIVFLYTVYWGVSRLPAPVSVKVMALFAANYLASWAIMSYPLLGYINMWPRYSAVFPLAVGVGVYGEKIFGWVRVRIKRFPVLSLIGPLLAFSLYAMKIGVGTLIGLVSNGKVGSLVESLRLVYFVAFIVFLFIFVEKWNIGSRLVAFLGKYSLEIYLLHFPFMVYYDFLLFRRPLVIFFFIYMALILLGAYLLRKCQNKLSGLVFEMGGIG